MADNRAGGIKTDKGGRPVTDAGGRPVPVNAAGRSVATRDEQPTRPAEPEQEPQP